MHMFRVCLYPNTGKTDILREHFCLVFKFSKILKISEIYLRNNTGLYKTYLHSLYIECKCKIFSLDFKCKKK